MRFSSRFKAAAVMFLPVFAAAQSCSTSVQLYNNIVGFPRSDGCVPSGYTQAQDLGNTSPSDAKTRCETACTNTGTNCQGFVAQLNKAADSNLYSGTCFLYNKASLPSAPRQCADKPTQLLGETKDYSLPCLSSSLSAATAYCSSFLSIGTRTTFTSTSTPSTTTTTTTVTTTTSTSFATTSTLVPRGLEYKRIVVVPAPACITSGTPSDRISSACSCLSIKSTTLSTYSAAPTFTSTTVSTTVSTTLTTATSIATTLCDSPRSICSNVCVDTQSDVNNCGACGSRCPSNAACINGACRIENTCNYQGQIFYCNTGAATCVCYQTVEGEGRCADGTGSCGAACNHSSDCGQGYYCMTQAVIGCRPGPAGYCTTSQDLTSCGNAASPLRLFKRVVSTSGTLAPGASVGGTRNVPSNSPTGQ